MSNKEDRLQFEASANLQRLIGRELVPNEEVAVVELVKNAYDSGAHQVTITIQPDTKREPGYIEVRDDGEGMKLDDLRRVFMFAGYSERPEEGDTGKRVPTGEKGIGRFAADRLGKRLTVFTKARGAKEGIQLDIDWEAFRNKKKKFHDITAPYKAGPIRGLGQKDGGTILQISGLRGQWSYPKQESLRRLLAELLNPFHRPLDFEINLQIVGSEKLSGPIKQEPPSQADIEIKLKILPDGKVRRQLKDHLHARSDVVETLAASANTKSLAGLTGHISYFVKRPSRALSKGLSAGVRLYRDGFRVEPFASPTADWLGISEHRAKRAGHAHIVPSRLFGFVEISRREHPELKDTTSRQALIEGEAARGLVTCLKEQLQFLEEKIRREVAEPRWKESRRRQAVEFEQARLQTLGVMSYGLAHELRQPLQTIRSEAGNIRTRLEQLGIKDRDIAEAQQNIDVSIDRIDKNINHIADVSKGSPADIVTFDLADMVRNECQLAQDRCSPLGIQLITSLPKTQEAVFNRFTVSTILINLLNNSIRALEEVTDGRNRKINVALSKKANMHVVEVSDNGVGISDEMRSKIFKKFASKKTGGMGVGLYYCSLLVRAFGGDISFVSRANDGSTFTVKFPDGET